MPSVWDCFLCYDKVRLVKVERVGQDVGPTDLAQETIRKSQSLTPLLPVIGWKRLLFSNSLFLTGKVERPLEKAHFGGTTL